MPKKEEICSILLTINRKKKKKMHTYKYVLTFLSVNIFHLRLIAVCFIRLLLVYLTIRWLIQLLVVNLNVVYLITCGSFDRLWLIRLLVVGLTVV